MTPIKLLGLLLLTLSPILIPPTTAWTIDIYTSAACNGPALTGTGKDSACTAVEGGRSWALTFADGCAFSSWSGDNCEGSSTVPTGESGCYDVPFGSIWVDCTAEGD